MQSTIRFVALYFFACSPNTRANRRYVHAGLRADGLAAKTTGGRVGKRLMEACYIADLLLGWQDEGRARPAWTYRLFARVFGEQAKK